MIARLASLHQRLTSVEAEQTKMNDCYFDKKDWRACSKEVSQSDLVQLLNLPEQYQEAIALIGYLSSIDLFADYWPARWKPFANVGREREMMNGRTVKMHELDRPLPSPTRLQQRVSHHFTSMTTGP